MSSIFKREEKSYEFEIKLSEDRFYFPGETIAGSVRFKLLKPAKTNAIRIRFYGEIQTFIKDHHTVKIFDLEQVMLGRGAQAGSVSSLLSPDGEEIKKERKGKFETITLEPGLHTYPFEFMVPDTNAPSSMEIYKEGTIRYMIQAIHEKPMMLEMDSRFPKAEVTVHIIERIDVTQEPFGKPTEDIRDVLVENGAPGMKATVRVSLPKMGYVRGEPVPIKVDINHVMAFRRENGVHITLQRVGQFVTHKHLTVISTSIVSSTYDINIPPAKALTQSISGKFLIPTDTPPTIDTNGKIIYIQYNVIVEVDLDPNPPDNPPDKSPRKPNSNASSKNNEPPQVRRPGQLTIEIPIVIGTWPFAAVLIDDYDDGVSDQQNVTIEPIVLICPDPNVVLPQNGTTAAPPGDSDVLVNSQTYPYSSPATIQMPIPLPYVPSSPSLSPTTPHSSLPPPSHLVSARRSSTNLPPPLPPPHAPTPTTISFPSSPFSTSSNSLSPTSSSPTSPSPTSPSPTSPSPTSPSPSPAPDNTSVSEVDSDVSTLYWKAFDTDSDDSDASDPLMIVARLSRMREIPREHLVPTT